MHIPHGATALSVAVALLSSACVTRTVGVREVALAYVANGDDPESCACVDRCLTAAEGADVEQTGPPEQSAPERRRRLEKCVRRCPHVRHAHTTCAEPARPGDGPCAQVAKQKKIREANPAGIVGVALGGVGFILFTIAFLTGRIPLG